MPDASAHTRRADREAEIGSSRDFEKVRREAASGPEEGPAQLPGRRLSRF